MARLLDKLVTVDRDGAGTIKGILREIDESGCTLVLPGPDEESSNFVYVAYEDIRGVGHVDWDSKKING